MFATINEFDLGQARNQTSGDYINTLRMQQIRFGLHRAIPRHGSSTAMEQNWHQAVLAGSAWCPMWVGPSSAGGMAMATVNLALPLGIGGNVIYGCAGPKHSGVCFSLRLPFRDETKSPPAPGQFDHEWVVSRQELDQAELMGRSDQVLLGRREREERAFLRNVERTLRREGMRLERIGRDLVLRRSGL
jgi:hypothetical protein